jgi:hypothetical protein
MNKARRILVAGVGALTPIFILDVTARAAVGPAQNGTAQAGIASPYQEALKRALLALSPGKKLRIAGDRIRLSANAVKPPPKQDRENYSVVQSQTNVARCAIAPGGGSTKEHHENAWWSAASTIAERKPFLVNNRQGERWCTLAKPGTRSCASFSRLSLPHASAPAPRPGV